MLYAGPECQRAAAGGSVRGKPLYALLYFCDDSKDVVLLAPNIRDLYIETGNEKWTTALLAFGGHVIAVVQQGSISHNQVGSAVVVMDQAQVHLQHTVVSNNLGLEGVGVIAVQNAVFNLTHSVISDNAAGTSTGNASSTSSSSIGGAVLAVGAAVIHLQSSVLANNTAGFGPGFYGKEFVTFLIKESEIQNNTAALVSCCSSSSNITAILGNLVSPLPQLHLIRTLISDLSQLATAFSSTSLT